MDHSSAMAKKQFDENHRLFGPSATQPEKFNLYAGLSNLAASIGSLHDEVQDLKRRLADTEARLRSLSK